MESLFSRLGRADFRAGENETCLYCETSLPSESGEHIFNACWGGSHKSTKIICDDCNEYFSSIDTAFEEYVFMVMNAWGFKGDRHSEIPELDTRSDYKLKSGAKPELKEAQIEVEEVDEGRQISIQARSKREVRRKLLDNDEEVLGFKLDEEQKDKIREMLRETEPVSEQIGEVTHEFEISIENQYRACANTILECLAMFEPGLAYSENLEDLKDFVRHGRGDWQDFAVMISENLDSSQYAVEAYGIHHNSVKIVWSSYHGSIFGTLNLLDRVSRSIVIDDNYNGPNAGLSVVEEVFSSRLEPVYFELNENCNHVPLLNLVNQTPPEDFFVEEIGSFASRVIQLDSIQAKLLHSLEDLLSEDTDITEEIIGKTKEIFVDFFRRLNNCLEDSYEIDDVILKLEENGFNELMNNPEEIENAHELEERLSKVFETTTNQIK